jgi:RNA polymerase sigma-70 factor (ECF subfamily)
LTWCLRLGAADGNAEDAAHDVLEVVLHRLHTLREPEAFPAWIYGITRRVLAKQRRRAWFRRWLPGEPPDLPDPGPAPLRATEANEVAHQVWTALHQLADHHREVLVLCDLEERPDSEVAEMLGIPKPTVKSRLRRARAALRERVPDLRSEDESALPHRGAL